MTPLPILKSAVQRALRHIARAKDIRDAEVFASSTGQYTCRLNFTSEIPCNGVEEPKSGETFGIGIRAVFTGADGSRVGFGSEARDLSPDGIRRALEKARQNAVPDPEFISFPDPPAPSRKALPPARFHDRALMEIKDSALVEAGWRVMNDALKACSSSAELARLAGSKDKLAKLGLIVGGDVTMVQQRMATASTRMPKIQTDESTWITSYTTSMVERKNAKEIGRASCRERV